MPRPSVTLAQIIQLVSPCFRVGLLNYQFH